MNKVISKFIIVAISMIITAIGASLGLKAAVGVGACDALSQSISGVLDIKVGTFSTVLNISCVVIQLILLKREFNINHVAQIFVSILAGFVVNFMIYDVYSKFTINNYFTNILLLVLSVVICAIAISVIMAINIISFPLESCCMVIAKRINKNFGSIRQGVDIVSIIIALGVALIFNESVTVREGTVIAMVMFGPMLDLFMKLMKPGLKKLELVD